jgi:hypothetical protein
VNGETACRIGEVVLHVDDDERDGRVEQVMRPPDKGGADGVELPGVGWQRCQRAGAVRRAAATSSCSCSGTCSGRPSPPGAGRTTSVPSSRRYAHLRPPTVVLPADRLATGTSGASARVRAIGDQLVDETRLWARPDPVTTEVPTP